MSREKTVRAEPVESLGKLGSNHAPRPRSGGTVGGSRRWLRRIAILFAILLAIPLALGVFIRVRYGGGAPFPDRAKRAERPFSDLESVARLDYPPGNVAVSADGRVFLSFHPDGHPPMRVAELVHGRPRAYPDDAWQHERTADAPYFQTPLAIRIDRQARLWVLDLAEHGSGIPRIVAFDLRTNRLVHEHRFASDIAPLGSHLNDFQVSPDGRRIYIAEASIFGKHPAIIVYDVRARTARRVLEDDRSVVADEHVITVEGVPQVVFGLFTIKPGVDSIALDRRGEWLYFAAVTSNHFWRVRSRDLDDATLSAAALSQRVEQLGRKTMSDGITIDDADTLYVSDPEHSAVHTFAPSLRSARSTARVSGLPHETVAGRFDRSGRIRTLFRDRRLRWPDGFSFGPDGWVYFTCSSLQHVIMSSAATIASHRPYEVFRFRSGATAPAGQ